MTPKIIALAAGLAVLIAMPAQAQTQDQNNIPQSQGLTDLETALMADVQAGDPWYDKVYNDIDAKADATLICADISYVYSTYGKAYDQFQGVLDAIDADTVLPADAKPGEKDATNSLWEDIMFALMDMDDVGEKYGCAAPPES